MSPELLLKELNRMCETVEVDERSLGANCIDACEIGRYGCNFRSLADHAEVVVAIVEEWSKEHPLTTNADKFKEVFGVEPCLVGFLNNHTRAMGRPLEWWNSPYKELKEE